MKQAWQPGSEEDERERAARIYREAGRGTREDARRSSAAAVHRDGAACLRAAKVEVGAGLGRRRREAQVTRATGPHVRTEGMVYFEHRFWGRRWRRRGRCLAVGSRGYRAHFEP